MSPEAFARWLREAIPAYAADKVRAGTWTPDEAPERSAQAFAALLPLGQATPGHDVRSIIDPDGRPVGVLWFGPSTTIAGEAFIYDIEIADAYRGRGYGRDALRALEPLALSLGFQAIGLHVFGDNEIARSLYRTSGYVETDVVMRKRIA
jgi:RimJ/RimL family protein N-acetyltransferase